MRIKILYHEYYINNGQLIPVSSDHESIYIASVFNDVVIEYYLRNIGYCPDIDLSIGNYLIENYGAELISKGDPIEYNPDYIY